MFLDAFPSIPSTEKKNEKREKNKGKKKKKISASSVSPDFPQEFHHFIFVKRLDIELVSFRNGERERETRRQIKAARFDRRERRGRVTEKDRTIVSFIFTVSPSQLTLSSQPLHSPHRIIQQALCQQPEIHLNR